MIEFWGKCYLVLRSHVPTNNGGGGGEEIIY